MIRKSVALEGLSKAIERRCNKHGSIALDDLLDVVTDFLNDLTPEDESHTDAERHDEADQR